MEMSDGVERHPMELHLVVQIVLQTDFGKIDQNPVAEGQGECDDSEPRAQNLE